MALVGSVFDWNILTDKLTWNGFENYNKLFQSKEFLQSLFNAGIYCVIQIPLSIMIGMFFAFLLNRNIKFRSFFRGVYFLPQITGVVIMSIIFNLILQGNFGVLNYFISSVFGIPRIQWLTNPSLTMITVSLVKVWGDIGFYTVIFLGAIQAIPSHLLEAADIDGASEWEKIRFIKIPLLNPTIVFSVVMGTIWAMQIFTEPYLLTNGGPLGSSTTPTLFLYQQGFIYSKLGYASAAGVVIAVVILILSLLQQKVLSKAIE
jgi:ABC-type sugar transport system permease subunit